MKFTHNGIGKLADTQSCTVTEKRNGSYELKLVCPADGIHAEMLEEGNIILAKPSDTMQSQPFRIYKITTPIDGKLEVQARHISYQLNFITVSPFSVTGCIGAMQGLKSHAASDCPFDVWTDVDSSATFTLGVPSSFRNCLGGMDASVLDTFDGEFEWDRYLVKFHKARGADHNVHITYGKNLTDFKMEKSIENTITGVHPYWADSETQEVMELPEKVVLMSKKFVPYQKITVLDCTSDFQEKPTEDALREFAQNYIDTTDLIEPEIDIKIDFVQLWNVNKNGYITASESWRVAHLIPVSGDSILVTGQFGYMSGSDEYNNVVCYDMDRKFLGGCFRAENNKVYDNYVITLLPNTRFISITTSEKLLPKLSVYLYDNMLPLNLLSNYATSWQWMNGSVDIRFTGSKVTVTFPEGKNVYVCRRPNGTQYEQTLLTDASSISVDFSTKKWWAVYYDGKEVSADESGTKIEVPVIRVANTDGDWGKLFTRNRFVFAVFYDGNVVYAAPSNNGTVINGIDYGNPAKIAYNAVTQHKYRSAKMFLSTGQLMIDTVNRTIQVTKRILAAVDNGTYYWISVGEEPVPILDSEEAEKHHMLILAYDSSKGEINLYNTAQFRALGAFGYYIAAWYENHFWYPHMGSSFSIVLNGTEYKAGALFDEERRDSYVEKKYANQFQQIRSDLAGRDSRHMYLASGGITIDQNAGTIQVSSKCLGVPDTFHYQWITASDPVEMAFNTAGSYGMPMRILAYDASTQTINLYDTSLFRKLGTNGFYIASWYLSKLYNPHINPDVTFIVNGKEYKAGDLFADNEASFIPKRITDYVQKAVSGNTEDDIVTPSHWDCMEGRQLSIFYDCLSRHDGKENLYVFAKGTNAPTLTRNEYCMNYTPTTESSDFSLTVRRLDENDCHIVSSKAVQVKVHHKLKNKLTKNVCICGDSLVDNGHVATEVYRLLAEDGDCVIHQLGTRGPDGGKHEGRGSWTFARYLADSDYAGKTNAFWDKLKSRLDFQKYCETNGYEGIDYFLIALGTNDVSQGSTLYRTEAEVQKFVDQAKQFIDALLDKETGFPNCKVGIGLCGPGSDYSYQCGASMGIFHMSINTLNLALIKAFDAGKYHKNVTCFAHGLRTDRRLAFPYADKPVTNRFTETSRTLTNSIHPSARGYQAWADGYYCQIRAWLTEDSK